MTTRLRNGGTTDDARLGRLPPEDWRHVESYPLRALAVEEQPTGVPVPIGVNFYEAFYARSLIERRGVGGRTEYWVREGDLGRLVGGHALVLEPFAGPHQDRVFWWEWHDQLSEDICVSEAGARLMALLNRKLYQPRPIYDHAQTIDYWAGEDYSGTSLDAGLATLRTLGAIPRRPREPHYVERGRVERPFIEAEGIKANRWATDADEIFRVLGDPDAEYAEWLNSWGRRAYPHRVKVPRSVIARLHAEDGEVSVVTDR